MEGQGEFILHSLNGRFIFCIFLTHVIENHKTNILYLNALFCQPGFNTLYDKLIKAESATQGESL